MTIFVEYELKFVSRWSISIERSHIETVRVCWSEKLKQG